MSPLAGGREPAVMLLLAVLVLPALGSCASDDGCDPALDDCESVDDNAAFTGDLRVAEVRWWCCDPETNPECQSSWYWYDVITDGVPAEARLSILEESGEATSWSEEHLLPSQAADPDAYWDDRYVELGIADTSACGSLSECSSSFQTGVATLFPCTEGWTKEKMTWTVSLYEEGQETAAHCVSWGAGATDAEGCEVWTVSP